MTKVNLNGHNFERKGKMNPEEFVGSNEAYYSEIACEKEPMLAHKINDGDFDAMFDTLDLDDIKADMVEVYKNFLEDNY